MTALKKYQRLECGGIWRAAPDAQRRDVTVSFGEASLVLSDARSGTPLAHWSLPAVVRRNPARLPALYSPDDDGAETLELDDPDMIGALETVANSLRRRPSAGPRLRLAVAAGLTGALALAVALWLPGALVGHAVRVLPGATKAAIGAAIVEDLALDGNALCTAPLGLRALAQMQERLAAPPLAVLGGADAPAALALPGGMILLGQPMIEAHDSPEVAAGHVLAARLAAEAEDPLETALRAAGVRATFVLLTTGALPAGALRGHGARLRTRPPPEPDIDTLLERFAEAAVPVGPYARSLGAGTAQAEALIAADPSPNGASPRPVLGDGDWVTLQGICPR